MRKKPGVFEGRDDGRRPPRALVISMMPLQPGYVRVIFDDVDRVSRRPATWQQSTFVTFSNLPNSSLRRPSQKSLAGLGLTVLGILNSYQKTSNARSRAKKSSRA